MCPIYPTGKDIGDLLCEILAFGPDLDPSVRVSVCLLLPWPLALKATPQPHGHALTSFPLSQVSHLPGPWEILQPLPPPLPSSCGDSSFSNAEHWEGISQRRTGQGVGERRVE